MIREYKDQDLDQVVDVWYQASTLAHPFLEQTFVDQAKKAMREIYIPNSQTWVYEEDETVVGFIGMLENEIGGLFVLPNFHSKGIGTQLVNHVNGMHDHLEVEVFEKNSIGRAFYQKFGFLLLKESIHDETGNKLYRLKY